MKKPVLLKVAFTLAIVFWTGFAFSQQFIRVAGSKNPEMIKQQVQLFLNHLDIQENLHITIIFSNKLPKKLKGYTVSDPSPEPDKYQNIRIILDAKLDSAKQLLVLAHEMIHVKQYAKKEIIILDEKRVLWHEREFFVSPGPKLFMPWEKEAHRADCRLVILFKSMQNQRQEILTGKVSIGTSNTFSKCPYFASKRDQRK